MPFDFSGKRVVVCGGSRGIGRSTALGFAAAGAAVSICARGAETLEATRKELADHGNLAHAGTCDLADQGSIERYVAAAAEALGGIDVLVNNASGFGMTDDVAGWSAGFAVDVMAVVHASHAALPHLRKAASGCIVTVSSISANRATTRSMPYGAVKAAINHYTASQARLLGPEGIRVNAVAPGSIEFPGGTWEKRREEGSPVYDAVLAAIPFKRLGTPEEVGETIMFLASTHASWITGHTLVVDGGQLLFS